MGKSIAIPGIELLSSGVVKVASAISGSTVGNRDANFELSFAIVLGAVVCSKAKRWIRRRFANGDTVRER